MKKIVVDGHAFTIGRVVHYVISETKQLPMMITECRIVNGNYYADGVVFGIHHQEPARFESAVPYNTSKINNTWHFPSMWRPAKKKGPKPGQPLVNPHKIAAKVG